jgi:hypothetical protein
MVVAGVGKAPPPFSVRSHMEVLGGVPYHGPKWGWLPTAGGAHDGGIRTIPPGREAQANEAVNDEL